MAGATWLGFRFCRHEPVYDAHGEDHGSNAEDIFEADLVEVENDDLTGDGACELDGECAGSRVETDVDEYFSTSVLPFFCQEQPCVPDVSGWGVT